MRGRRCPEESCSKPWQFQSTPPCGGDDDRSIIEGNPANFNPRPLAGATGTTKIPTRPNGFQSTPPCGGDESRIVFSQRHGNFNPRPLAGATICTGTRDEDLVISIHAPLRGRRGGYSMQTYYDNISIHAPLRGRQSWEHERIIIIIISIHAPLRGRLVRSARTQARGRFQSTPPCGGDYCPKYRISASAYFNPRPLAGATAGSRRWEAADHISIHAPLRGRRWKNKNNYASILISIHAPLRGRHGRRPHRPGCQKFQSTPPCGGDQRFLIGFNLCRHFNPRPLAGATLFYLAKAGV